MNIRPAQNPVICRIANSGIFLFDAQLFDKMDFLVYGGK